MAKKQFVLDDWLKDKSQKVVTRCGFPVRIVCTDVKRKDYPILALVERDDQEEYQSFTKDGRFSLYNPLHDNFDLFIETADEVCEDEKVRKALIDFFGKGAKYGGQTNGVYDKDILAWLEKQEGCEHIKKDWLEHIKQSWYKEGFIDGKYSGGTSKEWTINDATTLSELIDFLENGTAKLQHDLTRYANWLKIQFTPIEKQGEKNYIKE